MDFMFFCVFMSRSTRRLTGSGSGFKASQKTGHGLKSHPTDFGEARNQTCDPWITRHRFIPYTTAEKPICCLWPCSLAVPVLARWVYVFFVVLCSTGSGSGFKESQKKGQRLKVSPDRLGEANSHFETDQVKWSNENTIYKYKTNIKILEDRKITNIYFQF